MVEDEVTDGRRIAELLASELTGLAVGPLADLTVVDADRNVEPTAAGAFAYGLTIEDERVGEVRVRPSEAVVSLVVAWPPADLQDDAGLQVEEGALAVTRGAAVKRAIDAVRTALDAGGPD
jgi:hypothetical protein